MLLKRLFLGSLLLILLAAGWRHRHAQWVQALLSPKDTRAVQIPFDNGSVRDVGPGPAPRPPARLSDVPIGGVRKCQKGGEVIYTDRACPRGGQEQPIRQGTVNVVAGQPRPAAESGQAAGPQPLIASPLIAPHLDGPGLRGRQIERAVAP
ncbi:hypothetical protein [Sphaerotilus hippei]|nr:hypothetical protein [Sphaerotilus hippei]